jgi:putative ABC transport system substrate-binding protein
MNRRKFITLLGGAATWPLAARAQQAALPVIGFLNNASAQEYAPLLAAFRRGLSEAGFVEGRNVIIEYRWAEGQNERLPALAADLTRHQVFAIAAGGNAAVSAAKAATTAIPIVFYVGGDPVEAGFVASLNRPGGNLTGVTSLGGELGSKRIELLHELVPAATSFALLVNPTNPQLEALMRIHQGAARALGLQLHVLKASAERDFDGVFASLRDLRSGGLVVGGDALFNARSEQLAALVLRHAVPAIYQYREFAAGGGLMSYGGSITESYRLAGLYTARILKGEKPSDLPVQQATKIELIINLKTAKALGIAVPQLLLGRADEIIE